MTQLVPAAVLWDMDGTLVDTEPYWLRAESELVRRFGGTWSAQDGLTLVGSGLWHAAGVLQTRGVAMTPDEIVQQLTDEVLAQVRTAVPWRAGALELLHDLKDAGIRTALVTMSIRKMAEPIASAAPFAAFDAIVAGDDVTNSKPDPEPYLLGAGRLFVEPEDCVALEDSAPGLASAEAAGAVCIGVPLHVGLPASGAYTLWDTLEGKTAADIGAVFSAGPRRAAAQEHVR